MKDTFLVLLYTVIIVNGFISCSNSTKQENNAKDSLQVSLTQDSMTIADTSYATDSYDKAILENDTFLTYRVNPKKQDLKLYYKDDKGNVIGCFENLENWLKSKNQKLVFAMNGGMYMEGGRPLGLFIQNYQTVTPINKRSYKGANFYSKPNGVFYIDSNNVAAICKTEDFVNTGNIKYATQSGPMMIFDGEINQVCKQNSSSTAIRNGVGILPDNEVVFVLTSIDVSFFEFMNYFKRVGCKDALFFDGNISRAFLPEKNWKHYGGEFGVMVGVTTNR
jgi:uncharacterized protein YigE (DUF2233 family)